MWLKGRGRGSGQEPAGEDLSQQLALLRPSSTPGPPQHLFSPSLGTGRWWAM